MPVSVSHLLSHLLPENNLKKKSKMKSCVCS